MASIMTILYICICTYIASYILHTYIYICMYVCICIYPYDPYALLAIMYICIYV